MSDAAGTGAPRARPRRRPTAARGLALLAGALLLAAALARVTWVALEGERLALVQRVDALHDELVQRALSRADAVIAVELAHEAARPWTDWATFHVPSASADEADAPAEPPAPKPSPLLTARQPLFPVHFQIGPRRGLTSPTLPPPRLRELAREHGLDDATVEATAAVLRELEPRVTSGELARTLERVRRRREELGGLPESGDVYHRHRLLGLSTGADDRGPVGAFVPLLLGRGEGRADGLVFVRELVLPEGVALQGVLVDHARLGSLLQEQVADLLPAARFRIAEAGEENARTRLATLPLVVEPGPWAPPPPLGVTPTRTALAGMWAAFAVALAAGALAWRHAARLAERRRLFVSAVTHELRTPLTTFCLYTQMLASGMVADEERRRQYLATLEAESERLRRIVESVLVYARIDGRPRPPRPGATSAEALLARVRPSLERRAAEAGMELAPAPAPPALLVRADPDGVERVLYNLVDNACKYAGAAADRRVHLEARAEGRWLVLVVRDHGPGLAPGTGAALFEPFRRGAGDAEARTPGVGLGLALAREVARGMGGDVRVEEPGPGEPTGARFALRLRAARGRGARAGAARRGEPGYGNHTEGSPDDAPPRGRLPGMLGASTQARPPDVEGRAAESPDGATP